MSEPKSPKVRVCKEGDLDSVLRIETESFLDPYDRETFSLLLDSEPEGFLVAEDNNQVLGYVASSARNGLIYSIAVSVSQRRKRIGWMLMDAVLIHLKGRTDRVSLQVRMSNSAAIDLYRRFEFREEGVVSRYYRDGEDALVMSLDFRVD